MEDIVSKSSKWSSTATNIAAMASAVGVILGVYYVHEDRMEERKKEDAREIMREEMQNANLLTAPEFQKYVDGERVHRLNTEAFILDYMASVDSALLLVLPSLADADRAIIKRLALIETKIDAQKQPNTDAALDRVWRYLEAQAKTDSTRQQHEEVMRILREINQKKLGARSGDRFQ